MHCPSPRAIVWPFACVVLLAAPAAGQIGSERVLQSHLTDDEVYTLPLKKLVAHGALVFSGNFTVQEGFGRPDTKGTGAPLSDPADRLIFPRSMNRVSGPDANSCAGCHNLPFAGGGGDFVANVFVLGQRFDFATLDVVPDGLSTKGTTDESGNPPSLQTIANSRNTLGMFGSGYIEMLARQSTAELQAIRDGLPLGGSAPLEAKGIDFGTLTRNPDDSWDVSAIDGLPSPSLVTSPGNPPSLIIRPFHQAGNVISLRQFTNNAFNHHHGLQSSERFGDGIDPDGDGVVDELTRGDITAATMFQACLPVPGRVIPEQPAIEAAVRAGEEHFVAIGCAVCHIPALPLTEGNWNFTEPSPYNPAGNLRPQDVPGPLVMNLNDKKLPRPRLHKAKGAPVTWVPAFTDFKLHDITSGPADPNREPLDMQFAGTGAMFNGNGEFLTRKLWGVANEPPYYHHGQYTTLREAVVAHAGDAQDAMNGWNLLSAQQQDEVIEFLKTLQVLPPGTKHLIVDEHYKKRKWPDFPYDVSQHL